MTQATGKSPQQRPFSELPPLPPDQQSLRAFPLLLHPGWTNKKQQLHTSRCGLGTTNPSPSTPLPALAAHADFASTAPLASAPTSNGLLTASSSADLIATTNQIGRSAAHLTPSTVGHDTWTIIQSSRIILMTPGHRPRHRDYRHDSWDDRPSTPPPPHLSSTGSGGWTRSPPVASSPSSDKAAPECPTYANATACHPGSTATTTSEAPFFALLSPLLSAPSLCPRTSLHQLTFADWTPAWDDRDNEAPGTDKSKNTNSDINGTNKTKQDNASAVDDTAAVAHMVNAHAADNTTSIGSGSPPLLSVPPSPEPPLAVKAPPPLGHILLDSGTAINYAAEAPWTPTPSIGDLSMDDVNPMAKLTRAISSHLAELDCQRIAISTKYNAFHDLLVKTQTNFDISAIKR
jgi:hypothetical protein